MKALPVHLLLCPVPIRCAAARLARRAAHAAVATRSWLNDLECPIAVGLAFDAPVVANEVPDTRWQSRADVTAQ